MFGILWRVIFMEVCRKFSNKTLDFSPTFDYTSNKRKTMNSQELREYIKTNCPNLASILTEEELNTAAEINTGICEKLSLDPREGGELDLSLIKKGFPQDAIKITECAGTIIHTVHPVDFFNQDKNFKEDDPIRVQKLAEQFFSTINELNSKNE